MFTGSLSHHHVSPTNVFGTQWALHKMCAQGMNPILWHGPGDRNCSLMQWFVICDLLGKRVPLRYFWLSEAEKQIKWAGFREILPSYNHFSIVLYIKVINNIYFEKGLLLLLRTHVWLNSSPLRKKLRVAFYFMYVDMYVCMCVCVCLLCAEQGEGLSWWPVHLSPGR